VERNAARQQLMKEGLVRKGDGKDVDHKVPLSKGGSTSRSNLRVVPRSSNTSFSRNKDGSLKSQTSKRESGRGKKR
jgi:5-methylcytosine-specific restriction endonuclease McrA